MCETCNLPTVSLRAPNRHPSFYPQSQRAPRADAKLAVSRIRHNLTQSNRIQQNPTKIRVCARARGNGVPFPFCETIPQRRQPQCAKHAICRPCRSAPRTVTRHSTPNRSAPQEPMPNSRSAGFDTIRHNPTKSNENSCVRTRARGNGVPFPFSGHGLPPRRSGFDASLGAAAPSCHANRPNGTPSFQLVAYNSRICYYFPRIGERRQS